MKLLKVGVIGGGFVGGAVVQGFSLHADVKKMKCLLIH